MVNKITEVGWPQNEKVRNEAITELKKRLMKKNKLSVQGVLYLFLPVKNEHSHKGSPVNAVLTGSTGPARLLSAPVNPLERSRIRQHFLSENGTQLGLPVKSQKPAGTDEELLTNKMIRPMLSDNRKLPSETGRPSGVTSPQTNAGTVNSQPRLPVPADLSIKTDKAPRPLDSSGKKVRSTVNDGTVTFSVMQPSERVLSDISAQQESVREKDSRHQPRLQMNRLSETSFDNESTQNTLTYPFKTWGEDKSVQIVKVKDAGFLLKPSDQQVLNVLQSASPDSPSDLVFEHSFSNSSDQNQEPDEAERDDD